MDGLFDAGVEINSFNVKEEVVEGLQSYQSNVGTEALEFQQHHEEGQFQKDRYVENYLEHHMLEQSDAGVETGSLNFILEDDIAEVMNERCLKILEYLQTASLGPAPSNAVQWHPRPEDLKERIMSLSFFHHRQLDHNFKEVLLSNEALTSVSRAVIYVLQVFYSRTDLRSYYMPSKPTADMIVSNSRHPLPRFKHFYQVFSDIFGLSAEEFTETQYCRQLFTSFTNGRSRLFAAGFVTDMSTKPTNIMQTQDQVPSTSRQQQPQQQLTVRKKGKTFGQNEDYVADSSSNEEDVDDADDVDFNPYLDVCDELPPKRKRGRPPKQRPQIPLNQPVVNRTFTTTNNPNRYSRNPQDKPRTDKGKLDSGAEVNFTQEEAAAMRRRLETLIALPVKLPISSNAIPWVTPEIEQRIYVLDPFEDVDMNEMLQDILLREDSRNSIARAVTNVGKIVWSVKSIGRSCQFREFPHKKKIYDLFRFILGHDSSQFKASPEHNRMTVKLCTTQWNKILFPE